VSKNAKHWYWEMAETDETGPEPQTAVLEKVPSRTFAEVPCPASAGWFGSENSSATHQRPTRQRGKLQAVVWGPEHGFVVEIAHRPVAPQTLFTKGK